MRELVRDFEQQPGAAADAATLTVNDSVIQAHGAARSEPVRGLYDGVGRICLFFTVMVASLFAADSAIDGGLRRVQTSTFGVFNRLVNGDINASILVVGTSRAMNHFDPRVISRATGRSAFNIGIDGSQTDMNLAVLKTYYAHNTAPALVVLSLDSFTFVTSHGGVYFPGQYVPYLNEPTIYDALRQIDPDAWKARYLPLYGYAVTDMRLVWMTGARRWIGLNPREDRHDGFQPRYTEWTGEFERLRQRNPNGVRFDVEPAGVRAVEDLIELCKQRGSDVLLVYSPVYVEMQRLEANRTEIFDHFKALAERYSVRFLDYSSSPVSSRKDYFYNSQHLNASGADAFSAEFATALVEYLRSTPMRAAARGR